jgi:hypothetical protein
MSRGTPSPHAANDGDANSPLSFIASAVRSDGGKNVSISITPSLRIGGSWICASSLARSRSVPASQAWWIRFASSTCSRPDNGSEFTSISASRPCIIPSNSSSVDSSSVPASGADRSPMTLRGTPAFEPGV